MELELGAVLRRTFGALQRNLVVFGILALVLTGLPQLVIALAIGDPMNPTLPTGSMAALAGIAGLISFITSFILQGALIQGSVADFSGKKADLGECISTGLKHLLPLIAIAILMGIALAIGFALLIVPGVILMVMWSVAVPARVAERTDILQSFGRSRALTKGSRWKIFFLLVIYFVLAYAVNLIIGALTGFTPGSSFLGLVGQLVVSTITGMISAVGAAALYFELRRTKEGVEAADILAVFD